MNTMAIALVTLTTFASQGVLAQELVTNGGFETGDFSGWATTDAPGTTSMYGVDTAGPHTGSYSAFFGGSGPVSDRISQTLATMPGQSYLISFSFANDAAANPGAFTGSLGGVTFFNASTAPFAFGPLSFLVTASASNSSLSFAGFQATGFYTLDNVSVNAAVPEPETYALMLLGLLGVGAWSRRRHGRSGDRLAQPCGSASMAWRVGSTVLGCPRCSLLGQNWR
jgi:hypothetical protein